MENIDSTLAAVSASPAINFGTQASLSLGRVWVDRIGFASIPVVGVVVYQKQSDNIVAVVRQHVYRALQEVGLPYNPETIVIRPLVGYRSRQRVIVDDNPQSPSYGKCKRMCEAEYTFEILDIKRFCQCYGQLQFGRKFL